MHLHAADLVRLVLIGLGATLVMDLWLWTLGRLGVRTLDFAMLGRWLGYARRGRYAHAAIAKAEPMRGERALGWVIHYAVGLALAATLIVLKGRGWLHAPTVGAALAFGLATVVLPLLVVQPALGAGFASARTATPLRNVFKSFVTHGVFGAGLYLSAAALAWVWPGSAFS